MSSISDLKNEDNGFDIDMTNDIDGLNNKPKQEARQRVDISSIASGDPQNRPRRRQQKRGDMDEVAQEILSKDNMVEEWKQRKIAEYQERMATFDEEREELIRQGKLKPEDIKDEEYIDQTESESQAVNGIVVRDDDIDFDAEDEDGDVLDEFETYDEDEDELNEFEIEEDEDPLEVLQEGVEDDDDLDDNMVEDLEIEEEEPEEKSVTKPEAVPVQKKVEPKKPAKKKVVEEDEAITGEDIELDIRDADSFDNTEAEEESSEEESNDSDEATLNRLKELATEKLAPAFKKIDIRNFSVVPKKASNVRKQKVIHSSELKVVKWVLPVQKQVVFMRQFTGLELQQLSEHIQDNSISGNRAAYRMIYDHIMSNGKPKTYEMWLKCTPEADLDHYFFAVFIASYKGTNYIPMDCPNDKCPDPTFLTDDVDIMKMVKFVNEDKKEEFMKIYKSERVYDNTDAHYMAARMAISDELAADFKEPTLFDSLTKQNILNSDRTFVRNNQSTYDIIQFIDTLYDIDYNEGGLVPFAYKEAENNQIQTYKNKISEYNKILNSISADEFSFIRAVANSIQTRADEYEPMMSYVMPAMSCPNCGTEIPEEEASAIQLVFTRYQLGVLVNTTQN